MFLTVFNTNTRPNAAQLVRVWRATGNPRTPLAAIWTTPAEAARLTEADTALEGGLRLCA